MGDWGANGTKNNITVKSGDSWTSLAQRAGLNQRQFEDLMRANPNILQLKAGQTVNTGGLRRNNNAYVSDYTAAASGMQTSSQLQSAYAANGTGGEGSAGLQKGNPVYGGNFGYNLTTRGGQSQLNWQNNPKNPAGAYAQPAGSSPAFSPPGTQQPAPGSGAGNANTGQQNAAYQAQNPVKPTTTGPFPAPQTGQQNATAWSGQNAPKPITPNGQATALGGTFGAGAQPAQVGIGPNSNPFQTSFQNPMRAGMPTAGYSLTQSPTQATTGLPATVATPGQPNASQSYSAEPSNLASMDYTRQKNTVDAMMIDMNIGTAQAPKITPGQVSGLQALYPSKSPDEIHAALSGAGYVQDVAGNYVMPGNLSLNGGPDLSGGTPSAYGDFAGLPAYQGPPPSYQPPHRYIPHPSGGGGSYRGGSQQLPIQNDTQTAQWRIGG